MASSADMRWHLRSAGRHLLTVLQFQLSTYGRQPFSVAGPMVCSAPGFHLGPCDQCRLFLDVYLKRTCSCDTNASSTLEVLNVNVLQIFTLTLSKCASCHQPSHVGSKNFLRLNPSVVPLCCCC